MITIDEARRMLAKPGRNERGGLQGRLFSATFCKSLLAAHPIGCILHEAALESPSPGLPAHIRPVSDRAELTTFTETYEGLTFTPRTQYRSPLPDKLGPSETFAA